VRNAAKLFITQDTDHAQNLAQRPKVLKDNVRAILIAASKPAK